MRNLLFLAYYFPPSGGVLRLVKLAKHLPAFGWRPLVVCPRPRGIYRSDPGLLSEISCARVFRTPSLDPTSFLPPRADAALVSAKRGIIDSFNRLFVPDNKIGWVPFAFHDGLRIARRFRIDAIFSSAPPYSSHLAGVLIKKAIHRPLVSDFRDAWSQPNTLSLHLPRWHTAADRRLERWVVMNSDLVTTINDVILDGLEGVTRLSESRRWVMPQGYDPDDFGTVKGGQPRKGPFTIAYTGTLTRHRGLSVMARALRHLLSERPEITEDLQFILAGVHRPPDLRPVMENGLERFFRFHGFLEHARSVELLRRADALWVVVGKKEGPTVSTSKVYEYLGAGKPILASVPSDSPAASLVEQTGTGIVVDPEDHVSLAGAIIRLYVAREKGLRDFTGTPSELRKYDRRRIAGHFAARLDLLAGPGETRP